MNRPLLRIKLTRVALVLEIIGITGIAAILGIIILNFSGLPEKMPIHFNARGVPDGFGNRSMIWILPVVVVLVYALINYALRIPHRFNYPSPVTNENAERQYKNALAMLRVIKTFIVLGFFYITYVTVQTAKGNMNGLGLWFLPLFLVIIFGSIAFYLIRGFRLK